MNVTVRAPYVVVIGGGGYEIPWKELPEAKDYEILCWPIGCPIPKEIVRGAEAIQFTGGSDVSPALYGETTDPACGGTAPQRDLCEVAAFLTARETHVPMLGICRGSQFLGAMCGGTIKQHIDKHGLGLNRLHIAWTAPRVVDPMASPHDFNVSSTHHQEVVPGSRIVPLLLGNSDGVEALEGWVCPESHVGAVQYHPEYMEIDSWGMRFYQDIIRWTIGWKTKHYTFCV